MTKNIITRIYMAGSALLILSAGAVGAYTMQNNVEKLPVKQYFSKDKRNAVWDWSSPETRSQVGIISLANHMKLHQINTVFVDVGSVLPMLDPERNEISGDRIMYEKHLTTYIQGMNTKGIKVFATAGDVEWSKPEKQKNPLAIQRFVFEYNGKHTDTRFAGLEFDIESYNQEGFPEASFTEKELVLLEFMDTVDLLADAQDTYIKHSKDKLELGFAIPYWFDNANQNIKSITWHDKTGPTLYHILDRLNALPKSNVVVMAYRDAALGNDGMIYHSRTEIDYAQSRSRNVAIIIGVEVTDVEPEKITFYGSSKTQLANEVKLVENEFNKTGVYAGIAINDLKGFTDLAE